MTNMQDRVFWLGAPLALKPFAATKPPPKLAAAAVTGCTGSVTVALSPATVVLLKAIGLHEGIDGLPAIITDCACRAAKDAGLGVLARAVADRAGADRGDAAPARQGRAPP